MKKSLIFLLVFAVLVGSVFAGFIVKTENEDFVDDPDFYKTLGNHFVRINDYDNAVKAYEYCLSLNEDFNVRNNIYLIYFELGEYSKAIEHLRVLIENDNDNVVYHYDLAVCLVDRYRYADGDISDLEEAIKEYEKADELEEGYGFAKENIAILKNIL